MLQLLQGDCLTLLKDISSNSVDLIICDLPYGCLVTQPRTTHIHRRDSDKPDTRTSGVLGQCAWDIPIDLDAFWKEIRRIRRNDHSPTLHFCTTKFGLELLRSNEKEFRYDLVWDKGRGVSFLSANKMPLRSHEMVYVFSKAGAYYNRIDISGNYTKWKATEHPDKKSNVYSSGMPNGFKTNGNDGTKRCAVSVVRPKEPGTSFSKVYNIHTYAKQDTMADTRCPKSVILEKTASKKGQHPTEKPVNLYKWLIERYCPEGGTVLDPTFGSCNSGIASRDLGRNYIGIEKDEAFYKKAVDRLNRISTPTVDGADTDSLRADDAGGTDTSL